MWVLLRLYVKPKDGGPVPKEWLRKTTLQAKQSSWADMVPHEDNHWGYRDAKGLKLHPLSSVVMSNNDVYIYVYMYV